MKLKVTLLAMPIAALVFVAAAFARTDATTGTRSVTAQSAAAIACGKTRTIGVAAPITGPVASLGKNQLDWVKYWVSGWNKTHKGQKIAIVTGDTQLGNDTSFAVKAANALASNAKVLAVVGPAGSQEVVASTSTYEKGGLAWISGSATRVSLTDGHTDGNRRGFFFRVVPNDGVQGPTVASYIRLKMKAQQVYIIDDQETYSQGLADNVQANLKAHNISVTRDSVDQKTTDFSSIITKIPSNTDVIYIPWQIASNAQALGQQLKSRGKNIPLFGSDGLFDPSTFTIAGSYDSFFPIATGNAVVKAFTKAHGGDGEYFGTPSYVAAQVATIAINKACADGKATRAEVRKDIAKVTLPQKTSVLGIPIDFQKTGDLRHGGFGIYKIGSNGVYNRVG
jgi:branched-chain amino acid transport system substrate-binding protein